MSGGILFLTSLAFAFLLHFIGKLLFLIIFAASGSKPPNASIRPSSCLSVVKNEYGYKEGIPRMLDNWDELGIKVTSHMVGSAVLKNPKLAKEIVTRGHEAAAHGMNWSSQYNLSYEAEKKFIQDGVDAIKSVTGAPAIGYNAN